MKKSSITVIIPTYNGAAVLKETIQSVLSQTFQDFIILIHDDNSKDNTEKIAKSFRDKRIIFYKNKKNLGCQLNFEEARKKVKTEITFFLCQDDILEQRALEWTYKAFQKSENIGAVVRPFYWFDSDIQIPVRKIEQLNPHKDELIRITDGYNRITLFFDAIGQLSGLAYRTRFFSKPFHPDIFSGHAYPFVDILKKHPVIFLKNNTVAVRIATSQSRTLSSIYEKSPIQSWADMFHSLFPEKKFSSFRKHFIEEFVAINYLGLIQIRNYAKYQYLVREIYMLIKYRWKNIFNVSFWFFSFGTLIIPPFFLIPLVDWYKKTIMAKKIGAIPFFYKI